MVARDIFGHPVQSRRLMVCTGPCCDRDGLASRHLAVLRRLLVERGFGDHRVGSASCVRRSCLGKCSGEPLAHVMPDDIWYLSSSGEGLLRIFEEHLLKDQPVAELILAEPE